MQEKVQEWLKAVQEWLAALLTWLKENWVIVGLIVFVLLVAAAVIAGLVRAKRRFEARPRSYPAKVAGKRLGALPDRQAYYITFALDGQGRREAEVTLEWFEYLAIDATGTLTLIRDDFAGWDSQAK